MGFEQVTINTDQFFVVELAKVLNEFVSDKDRPSKAEPQIFTFRGQTPGCVITPLWAVHMATEKLRHDMKDIFEDDKLIFMKTPRFDLGRHNMEGRWEVEFEAVVDPAPELPIAPPHDARPVYRYDDTPAGNELSISADDEPGPGGANHVYSICGHNGTQGWRDIISFQNGPVSESSVNGITEGALLSIILDRFNAFQKGPYACRENALAITKLEEALHWMNARTRDRVRRGVEGRNEK
jgi:hypothetical protein